MAIHLTPALEQQLQHLAAQSNSTMDEVDQDALEDFVACRNDLNEAVKRGDATSQQAAFWITRKSLLASTACYNANENRFD